MEIHVVSMGGLFHERVIDDGGGGLLEGEFG